MVVEVVATVAVGVATLALRMGLPSSVGCSSRRTTFDNGAGGGEGDIDQREGDIAGNGKSGSGLQCQSFSSTRW